MLHKASEFIGVAIHAADGGLGSVQDLFFDDTAWQVRYFVVDTGRWLPGRQVLLGPESVERLDVGQRELSVRLTREQVEQSPGIETHEPLSLHREMELRDYYGWPIYWPQGASEIRGVQGLREGREGSEPHLRSASDVAGYYLHARDGDLGHVGDFVVDEGDWRIRALVVDTRNWWPGKKVLIDPGDIESIDWASSTVRLKLSRDEVRNSRPYEASAPLEQQLAAGPSASATAR